MAQANRTYLPVRSVAIAALVVASEICAFGRLGAEDFFANLATETLSMALVALMFRSMSVSDMSCATFAQGVATAIWSAMSAVSRRYGASI